MTEHRQNSVLEGVMYNQSTFRVTLCTYVHARMPYTHAHTELLRQADVDCHVLLCAPVQEQLQKEGRLLITGI